MWSAALGSKCVPPARAASVDSGRSAHLEGGLMARPATPAMLLQPAFSPSVGRLGIARMHTRDLADRSSVTPSTSRRAGQSRRRSPNRCCAAGVGMTRHPPRASAEQPKSPIRQPEADRLRRIGELPRSGTFEGFHRETFGFQREAVEPVEVTGGHGWGGKNHSVCDATTSGTLRLVEESRARQVGLPQNDFLDWGRAVRDSVPAMMRVAVATISCAFTFAPCR
jgi:hypothetical protein